MAKLKYIFILNDEHNAALGFLSQCRVTKRRTATIDFSGSRTFRDVNFNGLLTYSNYRQFDKYLFFDGCSFGDTNNIEAKDLIGGFSASISPICERNGWDIGWVFIRITDYTNKNATIDNLLLRYESEEERARRRNAGESIPEASFMNFGKTIILNECFIDSRYTVFGNNISHEVINCFKSDNGCRYLYLCKEGILKEESFVNPSSETMTLPKRYIDLNKTIYLDFSKTGKDDDASAQYIFLRKVINIEALNCAFDESIDRNNYEEMNYNHQNIVDIFDSNSYTGEDDGESFDDQSGLDNVVKAYATFKITNNANAFVPNDLNAAIVRSDDNLADRVLKGNTMRRFIIEGSSFYRRLTAKIDSIPWIQENAPTVEEYTASQQAIEDNIPDSTMGIIDRTTRETYYSDLIAYVFSKSPVILNKFLEKAGVDKQVNIGQYIVNRESKNVDIFVRNTRRGNEFALVLENKIDAAFNVGETKRWPNLLRRKDQAIISQLEQEETAYLRAHPDIEPNNRNNQLLKYYFLARYVLQYNGIENYQNNLKCLIICPERNVTSYEVKKGNYAYGEQYSVKSYKLISEAISEVLDGNQDEHLEQAEIETIKEINKALFVHTTKSNVLFVFRNRHRFSKRIAELNEE